MSSEEFCRKLWNYDVGITKKEGYDYDPSGNVKTSVKDVSLGYDINNRLTIYGESEYTYDVEGTSAS